MSARLRTVGLLGDDGTFDAVNAAKPVRIAKTVGHHFFPIQRDKINAAGMLGQHLPHGRNRLLAEIPEAAIELLELVIRPVFADRTLRALIVSRIDVDDDDAVESVLLGQADDARHLVGLPQQAVGDDDLLILVIFKLLAESEEKLGRRPQSALMLLHVPLSRPSDLAVILNFGAANFPDADNRNLGSYLPEKLQKSPLSRFRLAERNEQPFQTFLTH